eukprot:1796346-Pleurochrysis_carterae.AAC.1
MGGDGRAGRPARESLNGTSLLSRYLYPQHGLATAVQCYTVLITRTQHCENRKATMGCSSGSM